MKRVHWSWWVMWPAFAVPFACLPFGNGAAIVGLFVMIGWLFVLTVICLVIESRHGVNR